MAPFDMLLLAGAVLWLPAVVVLGGLADRRFRASLPQPRPTLVPVVPEPTPLPYWAATPGPAQWSAIARRPRRRPEVLRWEDPPRPDRRRVAPPTLTASVAAAWDAWEAHLATLMLPEVA